MLLRAHEMLLANLRGTLSKNGRAYLPLHEARARLVAHTGQDFGDDTARWERWLAVPENLALFHARFDADARERRDASTDDEAPSRYVSRGTLDSPRMPRSRS